MNICSKFHGGNVSGAKTYESILSCNKHDSKTRSNFFLQIVTLGKMSNSPLLQN